MAVVDFTASEGRLSSPFERTSSSACPLSLSPCPSVLLHRVVHCLVNAGTLTQLTQRSAITLIRALCNPRTVPDAFLLDQPQSFQEARSSASVDAGRICVRFMKLQKSARRSRRTRGEGREKEGGDRQSVVELQLTSMFTTTVLHHYSIPLMTAVHVSLNRYLGTEREQCHCLTRRTKVLRPSAHSLTHTGSAVPFSPSEPENVIDCSSSKFLHGRFYIFVLHAALFLSLSPIISLSLSPRSLSHSSPLSSRDSSEKLSRAQASYERERRRWTVIAGEF